MQKNQFNLSNGWNLLECLSISDVPQLDGNDSNTSIKSSNLEDSYCSSVVDPDIFKVAVVNARSVVRKLDDVANMMRLGQDIALISETWEKDVHCDIFREMEELNGFTWISRPRGIGCGGGVGVAVRNGFGRCTKLDFPNPQNFETVWLMVNPYNRPLVKIVVAAFYSPPSTSRYAKQPGALQEYILEIMGLCAEKFHDCYHVIGGDINDDIIDDLLAVDNLTQIVNLPTRKEKILDILVTDFDAELDSIQPPLSSNENNISDHRIPVISCRFPPRSYVWSTIRRRVFREANVQPYRSKLSSISWRQEFEGLSVDDQVERFNTRLTELSDQFFPITSYRVKSGEFLWFSRGLKRMHRQMKRVYKREGNSAAFRRLRSDFRKAAHTAKTSFYSGSFAELQRTDARRWHAEIRKLSMNGGRRDYNGPPQVPGYIGKTNYEMATVIAEQMFDLTKDYEPINYFELKRRYSPIEPERLTFDMVVKAIKKLKLPRGLHPNDPPRELIKLLAEQYAGPLTMMFNKCLREARWPKQWKAELTHMIPKKKLVKELKDLRPIALTEIWSKLFESIVRQWIISDIKQTFSHSQYGGVAGMGTQQYMMAMAHHALQAPEDKKVVLMLAFDFSSAFNCLEHSRVIAAAEGLGVRKSILALLSNYLDQRTNTVTWGTSTSEPKYCRGGSGQGTLLSVLLFLITIDPLIKQLEDEVRRLEGCGTNVTKVQAFVDDLCLLVILDPENYPVMDDGTKVFIEDGRITSYLNILSQFSTTTGMRLNKSKTVSMCFGFGLGPISLGGLSFPDGNKIEVAHQTKLLGVVLDDGLSLDQFVNQRKAASMTALWSIQRLKAQGVSKHHLVFLYKAYVLSVLEYCVVPFFPMFNQAQLRSLESVQRIATRAILNDTRYEMSYQDRLQALNLPMLRDRWRNQFQRLAFNAESQPGFQSYFKINPAVHTMMVRSRRVYETPVARTERFKRSPINQAIITINQQRTRHY